MIHGHHILVFHNLGTKSHLIQLTPIMEELLADGTKVTAILFSSVGIEHKNFTEILLPTDVDAGMTQLSKVVMDKPGLFDPRLWKFLYNAATWDVTDVALDVVRPIQVQQLIEERPKVDAVVTMWSTGTIFAEVFNCPIILFSPIANIPEQLSEAKKLNCHIIKIGFFATKLFEEYKQWQSERWKQCEHCKQCK